MEILDHGYLKLIETWGSDERIVEAARMSTNKGFLGWGVEEIFNRCVGSGTNESINGPGSLCKQCQGRKTYVNKPGDEKLLRYLSEHHHDTPFEMAGLVVEVQAPILVFREWHRHRTQSYNEMSARYTPLPDVNYVPTVERCLTVQVGNKQAGSVVNGLTHEKVLAWLQKLEGAYALSESVYQEGLGLGIPKELARCPVPVARYSRMRASANLRNWLGFLTLRSDCVPSGKFAQWEIRQYANAVGELIHKTFPRTFELFCERGRT